MPLNGNRLGQEIADLIISSEASAEDKATITALWKNIATKIISEFVSNGEVTLTVPDPADVAMTAAVPAPTDGGAALKSTYLAASAAIPNKGKGTIS